MQKGFVLLAKKVSDWFQAMWIKGKVHVTSIVSNSVLGKKVRISKHSYCEDCAKA